MKIEIRLNTNKKPNAEGYPLVIYISEKGKRKEKTWIMRKSWGLGKKIG